MDIGICVLCIVQRTTIQNIGKRVLHDVSHESKYIPG